MCVALVVLAYEVACGLGGCSVDFVGAAEGGARPDVARCVWREGREGRFDECEGHVWMSIILDWTAGFVGVSEGQVHCKVAHVGYRVRICRRWLSRCALICDCVFILSSSLRAFVGAVGEISSALSLGR